MVRWQMRLSWVLRLGSALLLAALAADCAYAQYGSVSPNFAPDLTASPDTEPVTTLAIDLLTPQRPYTADPTGASLSANALNPSIYASVLSVSTSLTDTQLRDSSAAGRLSPYANSGQRLGVNLAGDDDTGGENPRDASDGSFRGALPTEVPKYGSGTGNSNQSSWGSSSSFGQQSSASSWGSGSLSVNRAGRNRGGNSSAGDTSLSGGLTTAMTSNSSTVSDATDHGIGSSRRYAGANSTDSASSRMRGSGARGSGGNSSRRGMGDARGGSSLDKSGQMPDAGGASAGIGGAGAGSALRAGGAASSGDSSSADTALNFFLQGAYTQSSLGESPFSSPSGSGELHFLNPNLLTATSRGDFSSSGGKGSGGENNSLVTSHPRHSSMSGASHSGLNAHPGTGKLPTSTSEKSSLERRSHLSTGLDSENQ